MRVKTPDGWVDVNPRNMIAALMMTSSLLCANLLSHLDADELTRSSFVTFGSMHTAWSHHLGLCANLAFNTGTTLYRLSFVLDLANSISAQEVHYRIEIDFLRL